MIKAHEYHFALDKCSRGIIEGRGQGVAGARARMEGSVTVKGAKRERQVQILLPLADSPINGEREYCQSSVQNERFLLF